MNNKAAMQGGQPAYVGSQQSPSTPPPSALCFTSSPKIADNKKHHRHHFHEPYHVGLCGCHRMSKSNCVTAVGEYESKCFACHNFFFRIYRFSFHFYFFLFSVLRWMWAFALERANYCHERQNSIYHLWKRTHTEWNDFWFVWPIYLPLTDHFSHEKHKMSNTWEERRRMTRESIYQFVRWAVIAIVVAFSLMARQTNYSIRFSRRQTFCFRLALESNQCEVWQTTAVAAVGAGKFVHIQRHGKSLSCRKKQELHVLVCSVSSIKSLQTILYGERPISCDGPSFWCANCAHLFASCRFNFCFEFNND